MKKIDLFKDFLSDPYGTSEKILDEKYKKDLGNDVYSYHVLMKQDKTWDEYINNVLIADFQYNMYG